MEQYNANVSRRQTFFFVFSLYAASNASEQKRHPVNSSGRASHATERSDLATAALFRLKTRKKKALPRPIAAAELPMFIVLSTVTSVL